jgi:hypothetical protein
MAKMRKIDLDLLVDIALEVNEGDPIDFGRLSMGKQEAFKMIGASILEQFDKEEYTEEDKIILLSTITKLTVENFLLNTKLLAKEKDIEV